MHDTTTAEHPGEGEAPEDTGAVSWPELLLALSSAGDLLEGREVGHARRLAGLARRLGEAAGLGAEQCLHLVCGALLHDLGLVEVTGSLDTALARHSESSVTTRHADAEVLAGMLDEAQLMQVRKVLVPHAAAGEALAGRAWLPDEAARLVRHHHERWDGAGYPDRLAGEDIPLLARFVIAADLAESVTLLARDALGRARAAALRLEQDAGRTLDPEVVRLARPVLAEPDLWLALQAPADDAVFAGLPVDESTRGLDEVLELFGHLVDRKSRYTRRHAESVTRLVRAAGPALGLDEATVQQVARAARIHDLGQLGVANRVLEKRGSLAPDERRRMQEHPDLTAEILAPIRAVAPLLDLARSHHERLDGCGYPRGLSAEAQPLATRLLSVADAYAALTAERPFRGPMSRGSVLALLRSRAGYQYDERCIETVAEVAAGPGVDTDGIEDS